MINILCVDCDEWSLSRLERLDSTLITEPFRNDFLRYDGMQIRVKGVFLVCIGYDF